MPARTASGRAARRTRRSRLSGSRRCRPRAAGFWKWTSGSSLIRRGGPDHGHLRAFLQRRVRDGVLLRLIGKWLKAGVLEEGSLSYPESGSPQGGVITPPTMLHNAPVGASDKRGRADPVHDTHGFVVDLHTFDQGTDNLAARWPVRLL